MQNVAPRLSDTPGQVVRPGPELGLHNRDVLHGLLGLDQASLDALHAAGVVGRSANPG